MRIARTVGASLGESRMRSHGTAAGRPVTRDVKPGARGHWAVRRVVAGDQASQRRRASRNVPVERPILNSPYAYPARHWELDAQGQPTGDIIEARRTAQFITPIPKPKKHKRSAGETMVARAGGTPPALSA